LRVYAAPHGQLSARRTSLARRTFRSGGNTSPFDLPRSDRGRGTRGAGRMNTPLASDVQHGLNGHRGQAVCPTSKRAAAAVTGRRKASAMSCNLRTAACLSSVASGFLPITPPPPRPSGTAERSPARKCWVSPQEPSGSPVGTIESCDRPEQWRPSSP
jgi:hypothetical protein